LLSLLISSKAFHIKSNHFNSTGRANEYDIVVLERDGAPDSSPLTTWASHGGNSSSSTAAVGDVEDGHPFSLTPSTVLEETSDCAAGGPAVGGIGNSGGGVLLLLLAASLTLSLHTT
jgi:hypothetical protein